MMLMGMMGDGKYEDDDCAYMNMMMMMMMMMMMIVVIVIQNCNTEKVIRVRHSLH